MYTEEVMDHFSNPRNVGEICDADGVGQAGNIRCGDLMWIYIKVRNGLLENIKFKTLGCAAAIATSSKATEMVRGKRVEDALSISNQDIAAALGGLPPAKMHCSVLAADALKMAVYDYLVRHDLEVPSYLEGVKARIMGGLNH
jgi:nitrogen fixation protein NifU and related proteins